MLADADRTDAGTAAAVRDAEGLVQVEVADVPAEVAEARVPATGQLMVGGWKPQSISRLATSSFVTPALFWNGRRSTMHSCATSPSAPV